MEFQDITRGEEWIPPAVRLPMYAHQEAVSPSPQPEIGGEQAQGRTIPEWAEGHVRRSGLGTRIIAQSINDIRPKIYPLGDAGYRVIPSSVINSATSPTELVEAILTRIIKRQQDYDELIENIKDPAFNFLQLIPLVETLLPIEEYVVQTMVIGEMERSAAAQEARALALQGAGILAMLLIIFPPTAPLGLALGSGLSLYGIYSGIEDIQQGLMYMRGRGADVFSAEQLEAADKLVLMGLMNVGLSALNLVQIGVAGTRLVRGPTTGKPNLVVKITRLNRATGDFEALATSPASGHYGTISGNLRTGNVVATNWTTLETMTIVGGRLQGSPAGLLSSGAGMPTTSVIPSGPGLTVPGGALSPSFPGPIVPPPLLAVPPLLRLSPPGASPLNLAAPQYEDFADLGRQLAQEPGSAFGTPLVWSVTPEGVVFGTPPVGGVPIYAPEGMLPPPSYFAGPGQPRAWTLSGPLQEHFTPFDVLPGTSATTRTLGQVRGARGPNLRGAAGEQFIAELSGGAREVTLDLPGGLSRRSDVISPSLVGRVNQEVKNYLRFIGRGGGPREVAWSRFMQTEINRDAMIMYYYRQQPVWVFTDAPPSAALSRALDEAGIPYIIAADRLPVR